MSRAFFAAALLVFLMGCVTHPVQLSPSDSPIMPTDRWEVIGDTQASGSSILLFGLPLSQRSDLYSVLRRAREAIGGDALIGVTVDEQVCDLFVFRQVMTIVHGTAIRFTVRPGRVVSAGRS